MDILSEDRPLLILMNSRIADCRFCVFMVWFPSFEALDACLVDLRLKSPISANLAALSLQFFIFCHSNSVK